MNLYLFIKSPLLLHFCLLLCDFVQGIVPLCWYRQRYPILLFDLTDVSCKAQDVVFVSQRQCITTKLVSSGFVSSSQLKQKAPKSLIHVRALVKTTYSPAAVVS